MQAGKTLQLAATGTYGDGSTTQGTGSGSGCLSFAAGTVVTLTATRIPLRVSAQPQLLYGFFVD
jgi:hypothetical protein